MKSKLSSQSVLRIRFLFYPYPDPKPAFFFNPDPDSGGPEYGSNYNTDPEPDT